MISRKQLKFIQSLQLKKYRKQAQSFIVEGEKSVLELIQSNIKTKTIIATKRFLDYHLPLIQGKDIEWIETSEDILNKTGTFLQNQTVLAVAEIPDWPSLDLTTVPYLPVYDFLQDPGNLGTILRICDWFGIGSIILSGDSVDVYNPKVVQASMGSFTRVKVYYQDLRNLLISSGHALIGTTLDGEDVHEFNWPDRGMIVFGNESRGISGELFELLDHRISVPKFGTAESLNVGVATGIVFDNLMRSVKTQGPQGD
jgi:RNA methyltransferase, TrmH family